MIFSILVPHKIAQDLFHPGSFIFMRNPSTMQFYDTPISIMDVNLEENTIKVAIDVKGIKTKNINKLKEDDKVLVRAPFWNGVFGLKNIYMAREGTSLVLARGIGMAPMVPVLKKLYANGNKIIAIIDKTPYENIFIDKYLKMYDAKIIELNTIQNGKLTDEVKEQLVKLTQEENVNILHCAGPDILIYNIEKFMGGKVKLSCCNNAKMCCGEGVCGSCSTRYKGHVVKRLCKVQTDPSNIFEGRRLI